MLLCIQWLPTINVHAIDVVASSSIPESLRLLDSLNHRTTSSIEERIHFPLKVKDWDFAVITTLKHVQGSCSYGLWVLVTLQSRCCGVTH